MEVTLQHRDEFVAILENYSPAPESITALAQIPLVILLGMSGSGRNTIINHLVDTDRYKFIISDTTRPPKVRNGELEQNGVHYHFRREQDMLTDLRDGKFLEAEVIHNQQVSGISVRELVHAAQSGKIPINEVDVVGTDNIRKIKPDTRFFFVVPPSYEVWMERLTSREEMSKVELTNRLQTAVRVLEKGLEENHFTFVINDDSAISAQRIDEQVIGNRFEDHHIEAQQIARTILQEIRKRH